MLLGHRCITIVQTSLFLKGEVNSDYLPRVRGTQKIKKGSGSMVLGQVFLKKWGVGGGGGYHFSYLVFSRFIIFTFINYFNLCKVVLLI